MSTQFVSPPFIHTGMLVWVEMNHPRQPGIDVPCEILTIKESTVEVCDLSTRTCIWIPFKEIRIKVNGHPSVTIIPESPFHLIMNCSKKVEG